MATQPRSSHPLLSCTDGVAAGMTDTLLLIGRILIAAMFLMTVWFGSPNVGYLTSINIISPDVMSPLARVVEWVIVISLVLGLGTRYGALLALLFVVIATVAAHRYWGYPQAAQLVQVHVPHKEYRRRRRPACAVRDQRRPHQRRPDIGQQEVSRGAVTVQCPAATLWDY
jgi:putative oxidoreductase